METKKTVCYWCHAHCRVSLLVENGQLVGMEEDKDHYLAKRAARIVRSCPRAQAAVEWFYHPDRLKYPLKRKGEKGSGRWETIPWEQALDEVAEKLKRLKARYGAKTLASSSGTGRTDDEYRLRFLTLFGTQNLVGQGEICHGISQIFSTALFGWGDQFPAIVPGTTKVVLLAGANPEVATRGLWMSILDTVQAGARLIVVDPRRTAAAQRADIWLQVRPGTDAALFLGLANVIVSEGLYDKEFVARWCHGFDKLAERLKEYPPEKVAEITWIPAEKIREAARLYATTRPGIIFHWMGVEQLPTAIEALHARYILPAITGNLDVRGGEAFREFHPGYVYNHGVELNHLVKPAQKQTQIASDRFRLMGWPGYALITAHSKVKIARSNNCFAHGPSVYRAMITGRPYPVRAMITLSSNPMLTQANTRLVYQALKSLDLYVVVDYFLTPSADLADYVFPAASWLERPVVFTWFDTVNIVEGGEAAMPPTVAGQYERRTDFDFWRGLGLRLGQEKYWPWPDLESAYNERLSGLGMTLQELLHRQGGTAKHSVPEKKYEKVGFGTPSGKAELYSVVLERLGYDPLPRHYEPSESPVSTPELAKDYPLILITGGRHQPYYHSEHRQVESHRKARPDPIAQVNPKTAKALGIEDGDWIWIEGVRGRVRQRCQFFEGIDPRVVHAEHGWWFPELPGEEPWLHGVWESNINVLTDDDPDHCNPISGGWPLRTLLCRISKARRY